ncbi:hypothetical protein A943_05605 [Bacillus sp. CPSM8]|nr:hypothetical protein A943_05605 [Bacillus sp. CPSM8]
MSFYLINKETELRRISGVKHDILCMLAERISRRKLYLKNKAFI